MVYIEHFRCHVTTRRYLATSRVLKIACPLIHLHHNVWLLCIREVFVPAYVAKYHFVLPLFSFVSQEVNKMVKVHLQ